MKTKSAMIALVALLGTSSVASVSQELTREIMDFDLIQIGGNATDPIDIATEKATLQNETITDAKLTSGSSKLDDKIKAAEDKVEKDVKGLDFSDPTYDSEMTNYHWSLYNETERLKMFKNMEYQKNELDANNTATAV